MAQALEQQQRMLGSDGGSVDGCDRKKNGSRAKKKGGGEGGGEAQPPQPNPPASDILSAQPQGDASSSTSTSALLTSLATGGLGQTPFPLGLGLGLQQALPPSVATDATAALLAAASVTAASISATHNATSPEAPPAGNDDPQQSQASLLHFVDQALALASALGSVHKESAEANLPTAGDNGGGSRCGVLGDAVALDSAGTITLDGALRLLADGAFSAASSGAVDSDASPSESRGRGAAIRSDLIELGRILCRHLATSPLAATARRRHSLQSSFGGEDEASTSTSSAGSSKRQKMDHSSVASLRDLGFPPSLCILISKLLDVSDTFVGGYVHPSLSSATRLGKYRDVGQVEKDLLLIKSRPDEYLVFGSPTSAAESSPRNTSTPSSRGGGNLLGRERETQQLQDAYQRSIGQSNSSQEIVLISGGAGVGKSSLAEQLCWYAEANGGNVVRCAFDLRQVQPMSVVLSAFNGHCRKVLNGDQVTKERIRSQLKSLMGSKNAHVLGDEMPYLLELIGAPSRPSSRVSNASDDVEASAASNRFLWFFRLFLRGIATPDHPLCLCLDDLHCVTKDVLDLICALSADNNVGSLLIVGCYRDTETGPDHALQSTFADLERNKVSTLLISLSNLSTEQVNMVVAQTLQMQPESTKELGNVVYAETSGNCLFVQQLINTLKQEGQLVYSANDRIWTWDVKALQSRDSITDNCVSLMKRKVLGLGNELQAFLKKAACLPDYITFLAASDESISNVLLLESAIREGLISKTPDGFKFTHSLFQSVIYSSIPETERKVLHLGIGRDLWSHSSVEELEASIYIVVDQLRRCADLMTDPDERAEYAKLCLMAGEKATKISAFPSSCEYFLQGTSMLSEGDWKNQNYDLNLRLHTACAEAQNMIGKSERRRNDEICVFQHQFCRLIFSHRLHAMSIFFCHTGDYNGSFITVNAVLENGRSLKDKLQAYTTLIMSLGSQGKMMQAIEAGLDTLSMIGLKLPLHPTQEDVRTVLRETRALLVNKSYSDITAFGLMTDPVTLGATHILTILSRYAYVCNQKLMHVIACHQVKYTCEFGLSKDSPYGFAAFGNCLGHADGSITKALNYGKWALALLDALNVRSMVPRCTTVLSDLFSYIEGSQSRLQSQMMAVEVGLRGGDVESALTCANIYLFTALQTGGRPLDALTNELSRYIKEMTLRKHYAIAVAIPIRQALQNFQSVSIDGDPTIITPLNSGGVGNKRGIVLYREYILRLMLACFFRKYDEAKTIIKQCDEFHKTNKFESISSQDVEESFLVGIICTSIIENCFDEEDDVIDYAQRALDATKKFEEWAKNGPHFQHRLALLQAQVAFSIERDHEKAAPLYEEAIRLAEEHAFVHEQALACELSAFYERKAHVDFPKARQIFQVARKLYGAWGATAKVTDMDEMIDSCDVPLSSLWA